MNEIDQIEDFIQLVAEKTQNEGGSTSRPFNAEFAQVIDAWAFPLFPGRTVILPLEIDLVTELKRFVFTNRDVLLRPDCWLGTWINTQSGEYYFDITTRCSDLQEAKIQAIGASRRDGRQIVALYNALTNETVFLEQEE